MLKVKKGDEDGEGWLAPIRERLPEALCLSKPMSSLETRSLINACDCFVSLHRAEGFGRGTGEAMFLGRLAMATGWSGNLDYMTPENSLLVDHRLVAVGADAYPHGEGQVWAEADVGHAVDLLEAAVTDRARARTMAARAAGHSARAWLSGCRRADHGSGGADLGRAGRESGGRREEGAAGAEAGFGGG